jgi:hypothetical protein
MFSYGQQNAARTLLLGDKGKKGKVVPVLN